MRPSRRTLAAAPHRRRRRRRSRRLARNSVRVHSPHGLPTCSTSDPRFQRSPRVLGRQRGEEIMDPKKENPGGGVGGGPTPPPPQPDCVKCFDALWFCYSPYYQLQNYYRYGEFDNCFGKWGDLVDCLWLKTRRAAEAEEILVAREKARPHIWTYRTVDEASDHWLRMYGHLVRYGEDGGSLVRVMKPHSTAAAAAVPRPATFPGLAAAATAAVPRPPPFTGAGAAPPLTPPKSGGS